MPINANAKVILAKIETTYGVDAAPTAAADAILTRNFKGKPIEFDKLDRNIDLPTVGGSKSAFTNFRQSVDFEVEAAGSGTAGTAAKWARLLQACGMAAPASLTTPPRVEQVFAGSGATLSSLTTYYHYESERRKSLGVRGTFGANFTAGAYPYFTFSFQGKLPSASPFDSSAPGTPDFTAQKEPVEVNSANTTFTFDGFAAILKSFEFSANKDVKLRNLVGASYVNLGNHAITGSIEIEAPLTASKDYWSKALVGAEVVLTLTHGTVAGNIVKIDMPKVQITSFEENEEDDVLMFKLGFQANVNTGSDDLKITTF